jgi:tRNA pseudouridine38-40 synthase
VRVKAIIRYDGTGYAGFQRQMNAHSIQADIEHTLHRLTGEKLQIVAAGRTDAGVHAEGQVIAFDTLWKHPLLDLHHGLNALLPEQISVVKVEPVSDGFHPRYDALRRHYRYTIYLAAVRNPLLSRFSLHYKRKIDLDAIQIAADCLVGRYDFSAFGSPPQGTNAIREVFRAQWSFEDPVLIFDIEANAFLKRMVRMVVGTLLRVGYGAVTPDQFRTILLTSARDKAGPAAAAQGLCLMSVLYSK